MGWYANSTKGLSQTPTNWILKPLQNISDFKFQERERAIKSMSNGSRVTFGTRIKI